MPGKANCLSRMLLLQAAGFNLRGSRSSTGLMRLIRVGVIGIIDDRSFRAQAVRKMPVHGGRGERRQSNGEAVAMSPVSWTPSRGILLITVALVCGCGFAPQTALKGIPAASEHADGGEILVYDNSATITGSFSDILPLTKVGEIVTIDRRGCRLRRMEFLMNSWSMHDHPVRLRMRLQLRSVGRTPDRPGMPFWQGPFQWTVLPEHVDTLVSFELPGVRVPQTFVWTLEFRSFDALAEAPDVVQAGPATVGDDDPIEPGYWVYYLPLPGWPAPGWNYSNRFNTSFYCRIYADRALAPR